MELTGLTFGLDELNGSRLVYNFDLSGTFDDGPVCLVSELISVPVASCLHSDNVVVAALPQFWNEFFFFSKSSSQKVIGTFSRLSTGG